MRKRKKKMITLNCVYTEQAKEFVRSNYLDKVGLIISEDIREKAWNIKWGNNTYPSKVSKYLIRIL